MADTKISALTAATALTTDDLFPVVDDPSGTPVTKKITAANAATSLSLMAQLGQALTAPTDPGTWVNQGSATISTANGRLHLNSPSGSNSVKARVKTAPATPWKVRALLRFMSASLSPANGGNESGGGLCFRQSSDGKLIEISIRQYDGSSASPRLHVRKWDTATSFNSSVFNWDASPLHGLVWVEIGDDGTNRTLKFSADGTNWSTAVYSETRTTYMTADQWGVQVVSNSAEANLAVFSLGEF